MIDREASLEGARKKRVAQICFWVNGRLVPTFFPAFQAERLRRASSNWEWPM